ncbi:MAG TPA: PfkB family carbohydrate kinase [Gaiellaceae bacterium]|jgi:sugar/nucleoside kinase (ribokinase family)|nr:PfkB family carbohydrate kinase [Gaiellaceae bacterium]
MRLLGVVGLVSLDRVDGGLLRLGGAPFYAARALRLLGQPALIATKIAPEDSERGLHALGLPVYSRPAAHTISFRIENDGDHRTMAIEELGDPWTPADVHGWLDPALRQVDWVHAGALTRDDFSAETLALLSRGRVLSFDGQGLVRPAEKGEVRVDGDYDPALLRHVNILKLSEQEAAALGLRLDDRSLAGLGVPEVVVTLGSRGAVVFADGFAEHVPTRPVEAADPTGSGDMFMAGYLSYRRLRHGPRSAARLAAGVVRALLTR